MREDVLVRKSLGPGSCQCPGLGLGPSASTASNYCVVLVVENDNILESDSHDSVDNDFSDTDFNVVEGDDDLFGQKILTNQ
jgi:hypothetical protein